MNVLKRNSFRRHLRQLIGTAAAPLMLVIPASSSSGAPVIIPGSGGLASWDFGVFTDQKFELFIFSSGVADPVPPGPDIFVNDFKPPLSPWEINLDISIQHLANAAGAAQGDRVSIFAEALHSRHPVPEPPGGVGDTYTVTFLYDFVPTIPVAGVIPATAPLTDARPKAHDEHTDQYTATASVPGFNGNQITSWRATLVGEHIPRAIPEPASWIMMILGFGVVGSAMRSAHRKRIRLRSAS